MSPARIASVAVALVVCAWFALGSRQALDTERASAIVSGPGQLNPSDARHAASLLRAASLLNPDSQVDVLRARLSANGGDTRLAKRILLEVVGREPMNVAAWFALAGVTKGSTLLFAVNRIAQLEPTGPRPR